MGLVYLLVSFRIYDMLSLILGLLLLFGLIVWLTKRHQKQPFLTMLNFRLLRLFETERKNFFFNDLKLDRLLIRKNQFHGFNGLWNLLLIIMLSLTAALRLRPVFINASSFSIESYKTLEYIKNLELKTLFPDNQILPKGLHAMIDLFFQFGRIDPALVVHVFGALISVFLALTIFYLILRFTGNRVAAIIGASVYGVFGKLLPINILQQVEANGLILSVVFLVLGLFFLQEYVLNKNKTYLAIALSGMMCVFFTNWFSLAMFFLAVLPLTVAYIVFFHKKIFTVSLHVLFLLIPAFLTLLIFLLYQNIQGDLLLAESIKTIFTDSAFFRFSQVNMNYPDMYFALFNLGLVLVLIFYAFLLKNKAQALTYFFLSFNLLMLLFLWQTQLFGIPDIFNKSQVGFLLSIYSCISIGVILHFILFEQLGKKILLIHGFERRFVVYGMLVFLVLTEILILVKTPAIAEFSYTTEPEGYARQVYAIQQDVEKYSWTAVSHYGAKYRIQNYGRFMDYLYFLKYHNPKTFNRGDSDEFPTKYLFIFTEKNARESGIDTELLPNIKGLNARVIRWCREYQKHNADMDIYYEDREVRIYRIIKKEKEKGLTS